MELKLKYSFDDEPVDKFYSDINNKKIEIHFKGYYDLHYKDTYVKNPCTFIIDNWETATYKVGSNQKEFELNEDIGIFTLILYMKVRGLRLEMLVNTKDNLYITLIFFNPRLNIATSLPQV